MVRLDRRERRGALLRFRVEPGIYAHADLFPWPELGDANLEALLEKLSLLSQKIFSAGKAKDTWSYELLDQLEKELQVSAVDDRSYLQLPRLLEAVKKEASAVCSKKPLVGGSIVNHRTYYSVRELATGDVIQARKETFPAIKIKTNGSLDDARTLSRLNGHWQIGLRLDCNEQADRDHLLRFLDVLPIRMLQQIDFIEDPFIFSVKGWRQFYQETGIRLALDRPSMRLSKTELREVFSEGAAQVYIHKPQWTKSEVAKDLLENSGSPPMIVVTSALGHPVGNLFAASIAWELAPNGVHGCMSHLAYRDDEIFRMLKKTEQTRGARIFGNTKDAHGIGYGLRDMYLSFYVWKDLAS